MRELATIGYEGADLSDFIATLRTVNVSTVVDVRELPMSRRKGFSKNALRSALEEAGIEYVHLRGLGDPKEGRDAARSGDRAKFLKIFKSHMKTDAAKNDLITVTEIAASSNACLLCYERDPKECHRSLVATAIAGRIDVKVKHLGVRKGLAINGYRDRPRKGSDLSQSAAAYR